MKAMKKALFVATYGGFFSSCEMKNMQILREMGYEIHGAANFECIEHNERPQMLKDFGLIQHNIPFERSPLSIKHFQNYRKLKQLMEKECFEILDTHNPIVSVISRIAARKTNIPCVIYTAHGFFFYKGCPLINNIIYKPIEYTMAKITDALITINKEDFESSKKMKVRGKTYYVHGVGFDANKIKNQNIELDLRKELGLAKDCFIIVSVGELNKNKNHISVIKAIERIVSNNKLDICYCICGRGKLNEKLQGYIQEHNLSQFVKLLGFRLDISQIDSNSNLFILPSYREGLPVSIMEAMACRLPILAAKNRGTIDLIVEGKGGYLFEPTDIEMIEHYIKLFYFNRNKVSEFGDFNYDRCEMYSNEAVMREIRKNYEMICGDYNGKVI